MIKSNHLIIGILAHVDAGKTTLAEGILYHCGSIRKLGRVDHKDAFLDTYSLERSRGITIFSKQAELTMGEKEVTLLDTPGHVDFSAEMERTLPVLDYAVLVISGADGVQGHTETLWKLLKRYRIPVFLFINKMDQPDTDRQQLLKELRSRLDEHCMEFDRQEQSPEEFRENLAVSDEMLMEQYLEGKEIADADIIRLIAERKVFPCYFGSALKLQGVEEFLQGVGQYTSCPDYPAEFGARVYKIARDAQDNRLTYLKITGGALRVKTLLGNVREGGEGWKEKADQIRIYSGEQFQIVSEVRAGSICAVTGLEKTYAGEGLGIERAVLSPVLEPVLTYRLQLSQDCNVHTLYKQLCKLEEEEPQLHVYWNEQLNEIQLQVMGEVQIEILGSLIQERFNTRVSFDTGNIVYKETIAEAVEGVGHFEPLRHYAEVHLLLEPAERGTGLQFVSNCSEDVLERSWQRLVLTHLEEKVHRGVLTGAEITDMKLTLLTGKAHPKHTEGGDFRQATYRAVRQGLQCAESILLEPVYEFRLEIPLESVGHAMADIQRMYGSFEPPQIENDRAVIIGTAPVLTMNGYQTEVLSYTKGNGRLFCTVKGYEPCHNMQEVIASAGYDAGKDTDNPSASVFCAHGAGFVVEWDKVSEYMHLEHVFSPRGTERETRDIPERRGYDGQGMRTADIRIDEKELEVIFDRTYGANKQQRGSWNRSVPSRERTIQQAAASRTVFKNKEQYLLVDGYNIIFAWKELKELAEVNLEAARGRLADILCNYQGFRQIHLILVFDAYRVKGSLGEVVPYHNIHIVYTKEAETADQYIEKVTHEIGRKHDVTVATSDALEQMIVWGQGAIRLSAQGLQEEIERACVAIREIYQEIKHEKTYLSDYFPRTKDDQEA